MITWSINDTELKALLKTLSHEMRQDLHAGIAVALLACCREHLRKESARRHASARRLGATPSGHLERATFSTEASPDAGTVLIASPGISRTFRTLTITPRRAKALTIPIAPEAYARRTAELSRAGWQLFRAQKWHGILFGKNPVSGEVKALYALKGRVTLPQDRSLLPTDDTLQQTARNALAKLLQHFCK